MTAAVAIAASQGARVLLTVGAGAAEIKNRRFMYARRSTAAGGRSRGVHEVALMLAFSGNVGFHVQPSPPVKPQAMPAADVTFTAPTGS